MLCSHQKRTQNYARTRSCSDSPIPVRIPAAAVAPAVFGSLGPCLLYPRSTRCAALGTAVFNPANPDWHSVGETSNPASVSSSTKRCGRKRDVRDHRFARNDERPYRFSPKRFRMKRVARPQSSQPNSSWLDVFARQCNHRLPLSCKKRADQSSDVWNIFFSFRVCGGWRASRWLDFGKELWPPPPFLEHNAGCTHLH